MLKKRSIPLISSLVAAGLFSATVPASADDIQVKLCETDVQDFVGRFGTSHEDYPRQLSILSSIYLQNGKLKKSKDTFDKTIFFAKRLRDPDSIILEFAPSRVSELAVIDVVEAKQVYVRSAGETLKNMAALFGPSPARAADIKDLPVIHIIPDSQVPNAHQMTASAFKKAEEYQLRAIRQFDKTPLPVRIEAYRELALWYRYYGQTRNAQIQVQILGKLMNTLDGSVLFPKRQSCEACGKG